MTDKRIIEILSDAEFFFLSFALAFEIFDEKRNVSNSPTTSVREGKNEKTSNYQPDESSLCEDKASTRNETELFVNFVECCFRTNVFR